MDVDQANAINQAVRMLSLRHRARAAEMLAPLGLHPGQEVLLLELARSGPMIHAQLSEALRCEPPSITIMARKLEAAGHVRRRPSRSDRRASVVELTDRGRDAVNQIQQLWCQLAEETVRGLPAEAVAELPGLLGALTDNVDGRRPAREPSTSPGPRPAGSRSKQPPARPAAGRGPVRKVPGVAAAPHRKAPPCS